MSLLESVWKGVVVSFRKEKNYVSVSLRRDKLCVCVCVDGVIVSFRKEINYVSVSLRRDKLCVCVCLEGVIVSLRRDKLCV